MARSHPPTEQDFDAVARIERGRDRSRCADTLRIDLCHGPPKGLVRGSAPLAECSEISGIKASIIVQFGNPRALLRCTLRAAPVAALLVVSAAAMAHGAYRPSARIRNLAVGVCGVCHGVAGVSKNPMFPNLAGQKAWYIEQQLKEFRDRSRGDAYAVGYMWGMASRLSNRTIVALAQYFAHQKPSPGTSHSAATVRAGERIYHEGIAAQGVPACAACHGPRGLGNANFPRLAGQHAEYILKQLNAFRTNMRNVAIMHGICTTLHAKDDKALADYLASLPGHGHVATLASRSGPAGGGTRRARVAARARAATAAR